MIILPLILLLAETGLVITATVLSSLGTHLTSWADATLTNNIITSLTFISLATTVSATSLIAYRIVIVSNNHETHAHKAYSRIVSTIVESSAIYALTLLLLALTEVIPVFYTLESPLIQAEYYTQTLVIFSSGMAPTVMVARLALSSTRDIKSSGTITHITGFNFESQRDSCLSAHQEGTNGAGSRDQAQVREINQESICDSRFNPA
ncbi:hypothetical protein JR316_0012011 [Psilocybe cubensis]|uniref:Uncharacterized protein n=1 Tax=Psilocybe cubensis TaxID=181762 RepID=A0ACB8GL84_PSICU|nr:hypothetical protein JR316_0012011 [Psilocybe cubensis]KAH9476436.1 hypothetical protein JR316_0012011 [Psilocybe cubensis]